MSNLESDLAALRIERAPERRRSRRALWLIVLLLLIAGGGAAAWWRFGSAPIPVVHAATVIERSGSTPAGVLNASGYVTARREATVSSKITGKVIEVDVEEGMHVREGQILAKLDDAEARAALAVAQEQEAAADRAVTENSVHLAQAKITLERTTRLLTAGASTQADLDTAQLDVDATQARITALEAQVDVAKRQVDLQQTSLDNTIIRAPFTGVAVTKDAQPGEMVSPVSAGGGFTRTGICTVVDMQSLEIDVDVNESYIGRVSTGQHVEAVLDAYPDWQIPAHVITVVPTADRQKATVMVRIAFESLDPRVLPHAERILPDMGVKVTFLKEPDPAEASAPAVPLVPKAAVRTDQGQSVVFLVHGDTVERRAIRVGATDGDAIEVLAGLQTGDRVVIDPPANLRNAQRVDVR